jgi:hypothetical protein
VRRDWIANDLRVVVFDWLGAVVTLGGAMILVASVFL